MSTLPSDVYEVPEVYDEWTRGWECDSCGAVTDPDVVIDGEPYHDHDKDCRTVEPFDANMRAAWQRAGRG